MTGAGSATLAFGYEGSFFGSITDEDGDGSADYYKFGRDPTEQDVSLDNQLQRLHEPGRGATPRRARRGSRRRRRVRQA